MSNADNRIKLDHDLTIYTAESTKEEFMKLLEKSAEIELDLSQVSEMDTAGLQLLIMLKNECRAKNGDLKLAEHSDAVLDVLEMCNIAAFFGDPVLLSSEK